MTLQELSTLSSKICYSIYESIPNDISDEDYEILLLKITQSLVLGIHNDLAKEKLKHREDTQR